jgi:hypothetical protein
MTHDPMCPCESHKQPHVQHLNGVCHYCQCDLIAKVRADQKSLDSQTFRQVDRDWYAEFLEGEGASYRDWFEMWLDQYRMTLTARFSDALFPDKP